MNDPVRPGKVDRVIASTLAFGTTETFTSEYTAYKQYPQIVIALKDQLHRLRKLGIAPIAASGQFGAPLGATSSTSTTGTTGDIAPRPPSQGSTTPTTRRWAMSTVCRCQPS